MKIFVIGSTAYLDRIKKYAEEMVDKGHYVTIPVFDTLQNATVLDILTKNKERMKDADEVHMIYDGRSDGTIFDFGMCFALEKPLKIIYLNDKHMVDGMKQYEATSR